MTNSFFDDVIRQMKRRTYQLRYFFSGLAYAYWVLALLQIWAYTAENTPLIMLLKPAIFTIIGYVHHLIYVKAKEWKQL